MFYNIKHRIHSGMSEEQHRYLFDSVMNGYLESFSPAVDQIFSEYESDVSSGKFTETELRSQLEKILTSFPRSHHMYLNMVRSISSFAEPDPAAILGSLCAKFKRETTRGPDTPPVLTLITSLTFDIMNPYHFQFSRYLTLIILSDIISTIFTQYPARQPIAKMVPCGYNLCKDTKQFPLLQDLLIDTWSLIFCHLSETTLGDIAFSYDQYIDDTNAGRIFWLISRVQGNQQFADSLLFSLHQMKKRKILNSDILSWLAVLLAQLECDSEVLNEFFKLAWDLRSTQGLKDGSIDLITTLFNRLPAQSKKSQQFFVSRVFKHAQNPDKVERSARAFLRLIQGDISNVFEARDGTDVLACIGRSGSSDSNESAPGSFTNTFMKVFFPKSPFSRCPVLFRNILIHLAALDINEFSKNVLHKFLELDIKDDRFSVMLMAVPYINEPKFMERSYCEATSDEIMSFNNIVRETILKYIPLLEEASENQTSVMIQDSIQVQSALDESNHQVTEFLRQNNCTTFTVGLYQPNTRLLMGDANDPLRCMIKCIQSVFTDEDFVKPQIMKLILKFTVNESQLMAAAALETFHAVYDQPGLIETFITECLVIVRRGGIREFRARCMQLLYEAIINLKAEISEELYSEIEASMICVLLSDLPHSRSLALRVLKHLGATGHSTIYQVISDNSLTLTDSVKRAILVTNIPAKPSMMQFPTGNITFDMACCSEYNNLWLIFLGEMMNLLVENQYNDLLMRVRSFIGPYIEIMKGMDDNGRLSDFTAAAVLLVYIDTFVIDLPAPVQAEEEDAVEEFVRDIEACRIPMELVDKIISSVNEQLKKALLNAVCFVHWMIIPYILSSILVVDGDMYRYVARALSYIIQNPENFNHIISEIFGDLVEFLSRLQKYFSQDLQINGIKEVEWTEECYTKIQKNEDLCMSYCILISAAFNNIQLEQIPEEEWPISYRQILVQFLIHWTQIPDSRFEKLKAYALNALIPIINAGPVFTNGVLFDMSLLDLMLKCQMNGYPVLDHLLVYHIDILIGEYVRQIFLRPKKESQIFLDSVLSALDYCEDGDPLVSHAGSLILLAMYCAQDILANGKFIMTKVLVLLMQESPEDETISMLEQAENLSFVPALCQFATEQVIDTALTILKQCNKITTVKSVTQLLTPWFKKLRLLPTHNFIIQGVPSKYRHFTLISFIEEMLSVSSHLNAELHDAFAELWNELLESADNNVVVLVCLFESEEHEAKEKIFSQLLEKNPAMISKYLSKRCSFAYWYFMKTQRQQSVTSLEWMFKVLTRAFIEYVTYSARRFTVVLHFAMLFVEEARELFETLIGVFGLDYNESESIWSVDHSTGEIRAATLVSELSKMLIQQERPQAVEKWALEATRWAVGACDIKVAYRSLVILNALHAPVIPSFVQLLVNAVLFHLSRVSDEHCDEVARYVGECFALLYQHIENAEVANFAFPFASAFLHCPIFQENCLACAMPIFRQCVEHPVLGKSAKMILVDAFFPFAPSLENDQKAQRLLLDITEIVDAPELYTIVAAFLIQDLPFPEVTKTYDEIMSATLNSGQLTRTFLLFNLMLKTASRPLADSILFVATELLDRYEKKIDRASLVPIFACALKRISTFKSAMVFIQSIARIDPSIASLKEENPIRQKNLDDVRSQIADILKGSVTSDPVPITTCKVLPELAGIIDQKNPPKIYPFATQYEMYMGLRRESNKKLISVNFEQKRFTSTLSFSFMSNKEILISRAMQQTGQEKLNLAPLEPRDIKPQLLEIPKADETARKFIVSPLEFMSLEERDDYSTSFINML